MTHFVAISETVRERIARCYRPREPGDPAPGERRFLHARIRRQCRATIDYLVVSALVPYKRIDQAVAACTQSGRRLIVIGEGPERARLEAMAGPSVRFLGWQPDEVIGDHYRSCRALLFPGEEDFGIVPIEALACGAPVIAPGRGGVAETVDDTVGRTYAEPTARRSARRDRRLGSPGLPARPGRGAPPRRVAVAAGVSRANTQAANRRRGSGHASCNTTRAALEPDARLDHVARIIKA